MDRALTLHFIDGTKLSLEFPEQAGNMTAKRLKIADLMAGKHIVVEAEGTVLVFPVANIKYLALSAPSVDRKEKAAALPGGAILGARVRS
jgi:hypothetical protein